MGSPGSSPYPRTHTLSVHPGGVIVPTPGAVVMRASTPTNIPSSPGIRGGGAGHSTPGLRSCSQSPTLFVEGSYVQHPSWPCKIAKCNSSQPSVSPGDSNCHITANTQP